MIKFTGFQPIKVVKLELFLHTLVSPNLVYYTEDPKYGIIFQLSPTQFRKALRSVLLIDYNLPYGIHF